MSPLRALYLLLAIWGAVHPMLYLGPWLVKNGVNLQALLDAWMVNRASSALAVDLFIAAIALTLWILAEVAVRRNWIALWSIPATFLIGVSCGLPFYWFLRTRPVA